MSTEGRKKIPVTKIEVEGKKIPILSPLVILSRHLNASLPHLQPGEIVAFAKKMLEKKPSNK